MKKKKRFFEKKGTNEVIAFPKKQKVSRYREQQRIDAFTPRLPKFLEQTETYRAWLMYLFIAKKSDDVLRVDGKHTSSIKNRTSVLIKLQWFRWVHWMDESDLGKLWTI